MAFKVAPIPTLNYDHIKDLLKKKIGSKYPKIKSITSSQATLSADPAASKIDHFGCVGIRLESVDGAFICQFLRDGFVLSLVRKYEKWDPFEREATELWSVYREFFNPLKISRIGLRYINQMQVEYNSYGYTKCFVNAPAPSQIVDWGMVNFFHRDVLKIPETHYQANIIQTLISAKTTDSSVVAVLDIDVYQNKDVGCDWGEISNYLVAMRFIKNKIFFSKISPEKIEEYK